MLNFDEEITIYTHLTAATVKRWKYQALWINSSGTEEASK